LHTATAGTAAGVQIVSGDGQTAAPGTRLPLDLAVRVVDADGNPVVGAAVSWVVTAGGGRLEPATSTTDADGRASTGWFLGPSVGVNSAQAVVSGVGTATFGATAVAGSASQLQIVSGNDQTAAAGQQLPAELVVRAADAAGNPVAMPRCNGESSRVNSRLRVEHDRRERSGRHRWTLGSAAGANTLRRLAGVGAVTFGPRPPSGSGGARAANPALDHRPVGVPLERQPVVQPATRPGTTCPVRRGGHRGDRVRPWHAWRRPRGPPMARAAPRSPTSRSGARPSHTLTSPPGFTRLPRAPMRPAATTTAITADPRSSARAKR
jgi:hypothetical protein